MLGRFPIGANAELGDSEVVAALPDEVRVLTEESVGAASVVAPDLGPQAPAYLAEVSDAFISGFGVACLVVAGVAAAGAAFAGRFLPARST